MYLKRASNQKSKSTPPTFLICFKKAILISKYPKIVTTFQLTRQKLMGM
jgi:hypothetical protein